MFTQASSRRFADPSVEEPLLYKGPALNTVDELDELGSTVYKLPEDAEEESGSDDELPNRLRLYRRFRLSEYNCWGGPTTVAKYVLYLFVVGLITTYSVDTDKTRDIGLYGIASAVGFTLYQILCLIHLPTLFMGRRTLYAWGGLYRVVIIIALNIATIIFFNVAFNPNASVMGKYDQNSLLIFMAFTVFFDENVVEPVFSQLCWNFQGAISADEVGKHKPIAGISNRALMQVARNASKAVGISDEAIKAIVKCLEGQRIRRDEEEALDDWTLTIYKLSKVVALTRLCRSESSITSGQYRNLVNQMILYMRSYMETGKISRDEVNLMRSAPFSFFESFATMGGLSMRIPLSFFAALIPGSLMQINMVSVLPWAVGEFTAGVLANDKQVMILGFSIMVATNFATPILGFLGNLVESRFSTILVDRCRRKMLASTVKGGTAFDEAYPAGKLVDSFSNQLAQLEIYTQFNYIKFFPQLVGLISGTITVARSYPFAAILFVSLIPVLLSVDVFTKRASEASNNKRNNDAHFMGKIASVVECRRAIRAGSAGAWVQQDLEELLTSTYNTHRTSFFRSALVENFTQCGAAFYTVTVLIPLGVGVIRNPATFSDFMTIVMALNGLIMPIYLLGSIQNQTSQFSAAIQTATELMRPDLDEEPPSRASERRTTLTKLANSVKLSDVKFRYSEKLPDVIKGVGFEISKGAYNVLCGGSGSGKTTVLNLLMRFRQPYAGSISWDGTSIYNTTFDSFREHVSVMFQQTMIYMGTVRDNILFGLPEVPGEVEKAAQDAEIDHFIRALPDGYDTIIGGDATGGMSGGQLQRVCLARALYRKPSILLLDEATSALDNETEHAIIETLINLRDNEGLTLVSVSHHPSTAVKANKIVMLDHGVIAEEGTYDELVSIEGGLFRRLVEAGEED